MKKFLMVTLFCSLLQSSFAAYEEMYNMQKPEERKSVSGVVERVYSDKASENTLAILDSCKGDKTQESFSDAIEHYYSNGAKIVAHTNKGGMEVITLRIADGNFIVHLVREHRKFTQIVVRPESKNYRNFKNYVEANKLIPGILGIVIESQELDANFESLEEVFNEYF